MGRPPRWDDPIGSACEEAAVAVARGLQVRPTLYGFEDGQPTLRVQPGLAMLQARQGEVQTWLVGLAAILGIRQVLLFSQARTTEPDIADPDLRDALATYGLTVEVAERHDDQVSVAAHLLDREVVDGEVRWSDPMPLDDGVWSPALRHALSQDLPRSGGDTTAGVAYALSRQGMVVEVAPGWHERYGLTRLPARLDRLVRPTDRRRARELAVRTRDRTRGRTAPGRRASPPSTSREVPR